MDTPPPPSLPPPSSTSSSASQLPPTTRRTRFVCISDTHNSSPLDGAFKLPRGDVLIHAGDLTNQGTLSELRRTVEWIDRAGADFEAVIVIAGNHDITLDAEFYAEHGLYFHNQHPEVPSECLRVLTSSRSITYLNHEAAIIRLTKPDGPQTTFKIFGSPYSPVQGLWAFGYLPERAPGLWDDIPMDADIVVTHTPPKYHCDESKDRGAAGCEALRQRLWRVRPRLAVCGHVHEGRGVECVLWDLATPNVKYKEKDTAYWIDSSYGSKKQALVDLSVRGGEPIENNGGDDDAGPIGLRTGTPVRYKSFTSQSRSKYTDLPITSQSRSSSIVSPTETFDSPVQPVASARDIGSPNLDRWASSKSKNSNTISSLVGIQGGPVLSGRYDLEALSSRMGRKETCIINAAIMTSSWPHNSGGRKQYNKPIVVDIDLPLSAIGSQLSEPVRI